MGAPLGRATRETGCMKFVPGTHKLGVQKHVNLGLYKGADAAPEEGEPAAIGTYSSGIDPAVMKQHEDRAIDVECEPGDVVLFSNLLFHRGGHNTSSIVR